MPSDHIPIALNARGDDVRTLQVGLEKLGYTIPQHIFGAQVFEIAL